MDQQVIINPPADPTPTALAPLSPLAIYQQAIEKGLSPADLERLLDLHERVEAGKAEAAYTGAMVACQKEMPVVLHDSTNKHTKATYASLETIQEFTKPIYTRHGFSLSWGEGDTSRPGFVRVVCDVMHEGGHTKRYFGDYPLDGTGAKGGSNMNALQGRVSSNTYAQRDLLRSIFNITIKGKDADGEGANVTPKQIEEINNAIEEAKAAGWNFNLNAFCAWLQVPSLDAIPQRDLEKALFQLREAKKAATEKKGGRK